MLTLSPPQMTTFSYNPVTPQSTDFNVILEYILEFIRYMVGKGGPSTVDDYTALNTAMDSLAQYRQSGLCTSEQLTSILHAFGDSLSLQTIQGLGFQKPHGYAGDYEIIDKIYQNYVCPNPRLANWDRFVHNQSAFKAVKNRQSYFLEQIWNLKISYSKETSVLNIASGPGRDMYESLRVIGNSNVYFDCVEQDLDAIHYAKSLCRDFLSNINFIHRNVFRFFTQKRYDLIWSGGLFDYFNDGLFKRILKRLLPSLNKYGKLIIGNFSDNNPSRGYMDLFDWNLIHRSKEKLRTLAEECGVSPENISVEQEPEGVNLFLHIVKA